MHTRKPGQQNVGNIVSKDHACLDKERLPRSGLFPSRIASHTLRCRSRSCRERCHPGNAKVDKGCHGCERDQCSNDGRQATNLAVVAWIVVFIEGVNRYPASGPKRRFCSGREGQTDKMGRRSTGKRARVRVCPADCTENNKMQEICPDRTRHSKKSAGQREAQSGGALLLTYRKPPLSE